MPDLELATTEEIIHELMRRSSFAGVIVWQIEPYKKGIQKDFSEMHWNYFGNNVPPDIFQQLSRITPDDYWMNQGGEK